MKEVMCTNRKFGGKTARIELRVMPETKEKITAKSQRCGLTLTEYVTQRALNYEPKAAPKAEFYLFMDRLCRLADECSGKVNPETEAELLDLIRSLYVEFIAPNKEQG